MDYVSVAWQWIFPALDNSAFQTTCHNIIAIFDDIQEPMPYYKIKEFRIENFQKDT
jgi:hypothetical protein